MPIYITIKDVYNCISCIFKHMESIDNNDSTCIKHKDRF